MNKKIHILTFHNAVNYGAVLQCYALYKTMEKNNICDVINYTSESIDSRYRIFNKGFLNKKNLKDTVKKVISYRSNKKKEKNFKDFRDKYIKISKEYDIESINKESWNSNDNFIVGSDQVWNTNLTKNDYTYFFDFLDGKCDNRYSYAASFGTSVTDDDIKNVKEYLEKFKKISVREKTAKDILNKNSFECENNIDPVFLLSKTEWEKISKRNVEKNKYILIYLLQGSDIFLSKAIKYAKENNLKVIILSTGVKRKYNAEYISSCSPEEFLGYFINAETIFTNSFHGISFSILFNKKFYYELQKNGSKTNSRLMNIISLFNLENQNSELYESIPQSNNINYESVNHIIEIEKDKSIKYLNNI